MKHQDLIKFHQLPLTDLTAEIGKLQTSLGDTKLKLSLGQVKNLRAAKSLRLDIVRLKTIYRQKQLAGEVVVASSVKTKSSKESTKKG